MVSFDGLGRVEAPLAVAAHSDICRKGLQGWLSQTAGFLKLRNPIQMHSKHCTLPVTPHSLVQQLQALQERRQRIHF